ncbi:hypothetical protein CCMA1212_008818 [Trichoderma ghanense]|uniref:Uncharacterized protein n=1 Tax=Trichoderma ghanense TaxID=65468 RepID=A0ABY2GV83_9HYPO
MPSPQHSSLLPRPGGWQLAALKEVTHGCAGNRIAAAAAVAEREPVEHCNAAKIQLSVDSAYSNPSTVVGHTAHKQIPGKSGRISNAFSGMWMLLYLSKSHPSSATPQCLLQLPYLGQLHTTLSEM